MTRPAINGLDRQITFYASASHHRETVEPIAEEAKKRGFEVTFSSDFTTQSDIGVYCQHTYFIPTVEAKLSIIMLHGLDMGYSENRWPRENWSRFDIGLLPGPGVAENWRSLSDHQYARPRMGAFTVGWPKSDFAFGTKFHKKVDDFRSAHDIPNGKTVLYAPTKETAGKVHDFVDAARHIADVLLIKHAPYENESELAEIYEEYESDDTIFIVDKDDSIMYSLATADVLISDQSSVLQEAAITNTVPISVVDWPLRNRKNAGESEQIPDFATRVKLQNLEKAIGDVFHNYDSYTHSIQEGRKDLIANPGSSAVETVGLIESFIENEPLPCEPLEPEPLDTSSLKYRYYSMRTVITEPYHMARHAVVSRLSDDTERRLKKLGIHRPLHFADKVIGYKKYR